jgi:ADP-heptose:LPS heptosyltransferase
MRILVIRRDNIGDLVCTTPLLRALRSQLPASYIAALVNRYNAPVLAANPDLDAVNCYQKAKHRQAGESVLGIYWKRLKTMAELRRQRFDWLLLPGGMQASAASAVRMIASQRVLVRGAEDAGAGAHEVEQTCHLLVRMGLRYETPPARVVPEPSLRQELAATLESRLGFRPEPLIGLHLSARRASQRWPAERFIELLERLPVEPGGAFVLLWAPGPEGHPQHPGDDEKAARVAERLPGFPVVPVATSRLERLIAVLSLCDYVICADGGAMHLAAALGKPIVCLFGDSDAARWRPWRTRHELLQPGSRNVADIAVADVLHAYQRLRERLDAGPPR